MFAHESRFSGLIVAVHMVSLLTLTVQGQALFAMCSQVYCMRMQRYALEYVREREREDEESMTRMKIDSK